MGFEDMLWRANVEPPTFAVGDEVCYYKAVASKDYCVVTHVRTTESADGDETFQEIKVMWNDYWLPASQFVRVRKITGRIRGFNPVQGL